MVVAEVPLWVVHSNNASTYDNKSKSSTDHGPNNNNNAASSSTHGSDHHQHHQQQKAKDSLALLEGLGGSASKAAIYSVDIHPDGTKFATGGGDGKVRIWNSSALFAPHPAKSRYSQGGNYESSGESDLSVQSNGDSSNASSSSSSSAAATSENKVVHDLTSMVRKKKDGSNSGSPLKTLPLQQQQQPQQAPAAKSSTTTRNPLNTSTNSSSPNRKHHHHHHHHQQRLLCTLSAHTGSSVLAVRFSTSGQYLASAGDDAAICIYAKQQQSTTGSGRGNLESSSMVEHWNRIKLCRGHALDAVGLAWAPDDSHLVSCSLDSNAPIIVWKLTDLVSATNTNKPTNTQSLLCNPYKILGKGLHTSTVKGVTFDPAGTYLASSGDDPSVCIWRAHDDWGLEKRIDANDGIFRKWKEHDAQSLSSQSLFRRLSWSTDGSYICSTNAVVKNKHVASTISREGWAVSNSKASSSASGAANLVGHKQPVVVCRHCPLLLNAKSSKGGGGGEDDDDDGNEENDDDDDDDPEYGNLLALGDKRGFVTVWSTRKSRPVFKIQCSETRCTVTDMTWGKIQNDLMLIVSLLDGQVVALRFSLPDEMGKVLKPKEQARVFQMRYGIDLNEMGDMGERRLFVGENSGPKLIENALQLDLEDDDEDDDEDDEPNGDDENDEDNMSEDSATGGDQQSGNENNLSADQIKATQIVARSKSGKKRVQPLLMVTTPNANAPAKKQKLANGGTSSSNNGKKKPDSLKDAMEMAEKAASGAEAATTTPQVTANRSQRETSGEISQSGPHHHHNAAHSNVSQHSHPNLIQGIAAASSPQIPYSTNRVHSTELPCAESEDSFVADCTNSTQIPNGSASNPMPCTVLSISSNGKKRWFDQLPGTSCSTVAASKRLLVIGTTDGCVHLYGTSPTMGWSSCTAFRSHPPLVIGRPIVTVQIHEKEVSDTNATERTDILLVAADGSFGVYSVIPELRVRFKGTIMPPMNHMLLGSNMSTEIHLPQLARLQLTDTDRLLLLLSLQSNERGTLAQDTNGNKGVPSVGAGGSLQAFVYSEASELWMRVADGRFVLSDFYTTLPLSKRAKNATGDLAKLEDAVRMGASSSTLKAGRRGRSYGHADSTYNQSRDESGNDIATRSHCEDRMACALALGSAVEFKHWLSMYSRTLAMCGYESMLRVLVDMLLGKVTSEGDANGATSSSSGLCWWLSSASKILNFDRKKLVTSIVIPEMSKNRALQRITNEISVEVEALP